MYDKEPDVVYTYKLMDDIAAGDLTIVSAARSLTCRDDLDSKWRLLLAENELSRVSLLSRISIEN